MKRPASRGERSGEHSTSELWLIPYADLLTLLLALFIVLFSVSQVDNKRLAALSEYFSLALQGGPGVLQNTQVVPPAQPPAIPPAPRGGKSDAGPGAPAGGSGEVVSPEEKERLERILAEERLLRGIQAEVEKFAKETGLEGEFSASLTEEGLLLSIGEKALFPSGSATLTPQAEEVARHVAQLLERVMPREVIVAGHTDNVPINRPPFYSNWELSGARAINFLKALLTYGPSLDPHHMRAVAFGEFRPVADNATEAGRAKNRRVEVFILRQYPPDAGGANP
ncbi:MAG: Flagellar motor rotation protein MotB [Brockia lithotrophica]|uniref:Flagellar motor rotation protein MotB n=1 Tax=Brockia lithotrophica TaxID=933949 RepID=A0A2T5G659_9BACL|nr:MAG: Flagellar motor rotation protein MotB [Brockia lithotrophica]